MNNEQQQHYREWIGKEQSRSDTLAIAPMEALAATLDRKESAFSFGTELPPLWHWLYFPGPARQSVLALDGHPPKGDFLPPIPLPRRMWAGSRLQFLRPLCAGETVQRISRIQSIKIKQGKSGTLAFVCVSHEISNESGLALKEQHDIVFRDKPAVGSSVAQKTPAEKNADYSKTIVPDPVLLFRYSALTFNGHRIHYDRDYVTAVEGYPGLLVHGPLLATLLVELLADNFPNQLVKQFEFRAMNPVFDTAEFHVCGKQADSNGNCQLWITDNQGKLCMEASAQLSAD